MLFSHSIFITEGEKIMATIELLEDDLDGARTDDVETREFALDGTTYRIDLGALNWGKLRDQLADFVANARKVGFQRGRAVPGTPGSPAPRKPAVDRAQNQAMREWAKQHGFPASDRGRLPVEVVTAYHANDVAGLQQLAEAKRAKVAGTQPGASPTFQEARG